MTDFFY